MNVNFTSGRNGDEDAGSYKFWTILGKSYINKSNGLVFRDAYTIRTRTTVWDRLDVLEISLYWWFYKDCCEIRRATKASVLNWCYTHPDDFEFAEIDPDYSVQSEAA